MPHHDAGSCDGKDQRDTRIPNATSNIYCSNRDWSDNCDDHRKHEVNDALFKVP